MLFLQFCAIKANARRENPLRAPSNSLEKAMLSYEITMLL